MHFGISLDFGFFSEKTTAIYICLVLETKHTRPANNVLMIVMILPTNYRFILKIKGKMEKKKDNVSRDKNPRFSSVYTSQ